jgi:hypothetical protein
MEPEKMGSWGIFDHPDCPQMTDVNQNRRGGTDDPPERNDDQDDDLKVGEEVRTKNIVYPYGEEKMNSYSLKYKV